MITFRRGTSSAANSYVLAAGEPGYVTDTRRLYMGDGSTPISGLPYLIPSNELGTYITSDDLASSGYITDSDVVPAVTTAIAPGGSLNSEVTLPGDIAYSAAKFGVVEDDGTTDTATANTTAMQNFINFLCPSTGTGYRGIIPFKKVRVNATLQIPKSRGWSLLGMGPDRTVIEQVTDNIPIFQMGVGAETSGATGFLHFEFGDFTLSYTNTQPSTNTSANCLELVGMVYDANFRPMYFQKGFYGWHLASGQVAPWGSTWDYMHFGPTMTGGAIDWSGSVNAIPGNDFRHIFVEADNSIGPLFSWRGYNWTVSSIEIINATQGPQLMNFAAGSECNIGSFKLEGGSYIPATSPFSMIGVASGTSLKIDTFSMQSSNGGLTINPANYMDIFHLGAGGTSGGFVEIGKARLDATSLKASSCFLFGGGESGNNVTSRARVKFLQVINAGWKLTPVSQGSFMCNGVFIENYQSQNVSVNAGDADYSMGSLASNPGTLIFQTALTASRNVTLSADQNAMPGGLKYRIVSNGAVNGSNTIVVKSSTTTITTLTSDNQWVDVAWQRNATGASGWKAVASGSVVPGFSGGGDGSGSGLTEDPSHPGLYLMG